MFFYQKVGGARCTMAREKKWRKILYEDQGVPDNYVDESFLDEMKKNCKSSLSEITYSR